MALDRSDRIRPRGLSATLLSSLRRRKRHLHKSPRQRPRISPLGLTHGCQPIGDLALLHLVVACSTRWLLASENEAVTSPDCHATSSTPNPSPPPRGSGGRRLVSSDTSRLFIFAGAAICCPVFMLITPADRRGQATPRPHNAPTRLAGTWCCQADPKSIYLDRHRHLDAFRPD
jgi:hypothetical protein